tara:strand:- start:167 stop:634 length:468 start_codon:yes stop_codon:yes gene_type:complete
MFTIYSVHQNKNISKDNALLWNISIICSTALCIIVSTYLDSRSKKNEQYIDVPLSSAKEITEYDIENPQPNIRLDPGNLLRGIRYKFQMYEQEYTAIFVEYVKFLNEPYYRIYIANCRGNYSSHLFEDDDYKEYIYVNPFLQIREHECINENLFN